ncbi:MAG: hypothetical protein ACNA8P_00815, partial [Phycisphaerales bacterium]
MPSRTLSSPTAPPDPASIAQLFREHDERERPRYDRFWSYYRNELPVGSARRSTAATSPRAAHRPAQAIGLPERFTRPTTTSGEPREIVIENDIAWRIDSIVDFVFGKPYTLHSASPDASLAPTIERALTVAWEASGGLGMLQTASTLASVHGHIDLLVRTEALFDAAPGIRRALRRASDHAEREAVLASAARLITIEPVAAPRGVPVLDPRDYRMLRAYLLRDAHRPGINREHNDPTGAPWGSGGRGSTGPIARLTGAIKRTAGSDTPDERYTLITPDTITERDGAATLRTIANPLGELPIVHIQNAPQPFRYDGLSDVEPLIALQDELNTRLSDRAHRVTMQSFKMYFAKGFETPDDLAVAPGQIWSTHNPEAELHAFGGDAHTPSEDDHINQIREALDKASGVSPLVLGLLRAKIGHLSSENALRITMMGVLSKTARRRQVWGAGITAASRLVLLALDRADILRTTERDRELT